MSAESSLVLSALPLPRADMMPLVPAASVARIFVSNAMLAARRRPSEIDKSLLVLRLKGGVEFGLAVRHCH